MASLTVKVVSPESTVFSGDATAVVAPAWDGKVGILPGHAPMIALLGAGVLSIEGVKETVTLHVAGGLVKVEGNQVTVLTEYADEQPPSEDLVRRLLGTQSDSDALEAPAAESPSGSVPA